MRKQALSALPLFIDYGQRNRAQELDSLIANCEQHLFPPPIILDVGGFGSVIKSGLTDSSKDVLQDAFTPGRNLLFITLAAALAFDRGARNVVLGLLSEETAIFPDQTDRFLAAAQRAVSEGLGVPISVICPLRDMTKAEVVALGQEIGIVRHYSCHSGTEIPCGHCIACLEYS